MDEFLGQASIPLKVRFDCVAGEKDKYEYDLHFDISTRLLKINYLQDQDIYASPRTQWLPLMCKPGQQKNGYRFDAILILSCIVIILNQLIQRRIGAHPRQSSFPLQSICPPSSSTKRKMALGPNNTLILSHILIKRHHFKEFFLSTPSIPHQSYSSNVIIEGSLK